jgi:hypothetical protein
VPLACDTLVRFGDKLFQTGFRGFGGLKVATLDPPGANVMNTIFSYFCKFVEKEVGFFS